MSKISDSFKRQIGRDAGKVASNFIFGDKHSTPYRRVAGKQKVDNQTGIQKEQMLNSIDGAVINAVDQVVAIRFPNDEYGITAILDELELQLEASKWKEEVGEDEEKAKIRNKYPDVVLKKFKQGVKKLEKTDADEETKKHYTKIFTKYRRKQIWAKYNYWFVLLGIAIFIIILSLFAD